MRGQHIGRVRLVGICLASLLIPLALVVTACEAGGVDTGTAPKTTTGTAAATAASAEDETTSSLAAPVSANTDGPDWLGTTSTGTGPADLYCSVAFAASRPKGFVAVSLFNEAGEFVDSRKGLPSTFKGLEPGKYRLGAFGVDTGYISQWYGGLPVQGHDISESQVLELQPGRNFAEFVLQPGLSIQGDVSWTQGTPQSGYIQAYDLQHRDTGRSTGVGGTYVVGGPESLMAGTDYTFLIVGLLPGRYKIGVSFDAAFSPPQFWDGGGSFEDAPVIDLTSGDITGIRVELGALPTTTTATTSLQ
jgi:hypothetical protein